MEQSDRQMMALLEVQNRRMRTQNLLLIAGVALLLILLLLLAVTVTAVTPRLEKTLEEVEALTASMTAISEQLEDPQLVANFKLAVENIQAVAGNLDNISEQFVGMDLAGKLEDLSKGIQETGEMLTYHGVMLQVAEAVLTYQDKKVELTRNELRILKTLMENKEKVVSRDTLMTKLWESDCFVDENTLSVNVNRLRRKLADAGLEDFILTKKGIGYRLK